MIGKHTKPSILLLCDYQKNGAATVSDHIDAICSSKLCSVEKLPIRGTCPDYLDLSYFDVVIIHYSLVMCSDSYVAPSIRDMLRDYQGLKVCFIQDEYQFINDKLNAMKHMGMDLLFTCMQPSEQLKVYSPEILPGLKFVHVLTGYVPESLTKISNLPDHKDRHIDVCYRGRDLAYWYGELAQEKKRIADRFHADGLPYGLNMNISVKEEDRLYGKQWINLLSSSKATLGTESGASVFDFTGEIWKQCQQYVADNPTASFEEVSDLFLKDIDGQIYINQISPRVFEAAALKTLMINYEGEYSGILKPFRHYIPLKKDHSNMSEVIKILRDKEAVKEMTENTYHEIALNPQLSYNEFTRIVETEIIKALEEKYSLISSVASNSSFRSDKSTSHLTFPKRARMIMENYSVEKGSSHIKLNPYCSTFHSKPGAYSAICRFRYSIIRNIIYVKYMAASNRVYIRYITIRQKLLTKRIRLKSNLLYFKQNLRSSIKAVLNKMLWNLILRWVSESKQQNIKFFLKRAIGRRP
jgi:hypothetical protein